MNFLVWIMKSEVLLKKYENILGIGEIGWRDFEDTLYDWSSSEGDL